MASTCSIAWEASAAAVDRSDLFRDFGRFGGLSGERLHLRRDDCKPFTGFTGARGNGGIEREQIGLSGNGLIRPTTSPMRVAALPSSDIV